jgi:biopolymer transport protein ExbD
MKMKGAKQVHYDSGPNMTPLVDVVMVILIFLMLAGKFGENEHYLASSVPIRKGGGQRTDPIPNDVDFHIQVDALADRFQARVEGVDDPVTDKDSLTRVLSERLAAYLSIGKTPDNLQVLIGPGRTVKYNFLIQVYESALAAQSGEGANAKHFTKVAFEQSH